MTAVNLHGELIIQHLKKFNFQPVDVLETETCRHLTNMQLTFGRQRPRAHATNVDTSLNGEAVCNLMNGVKITRNIEANAALDYKNVRQSNISVP